MYLTLVIAFIRGCWEELAPLGTNISAVAFGELASTLTVRKSPVAPETNADPLPLLNLLLVFVNVFRPMLDISESPSRSHLSSPIYLSSQSTPTYQ